MGEYMAERMDQQIEGSIIEYERMCERMEILEDALVKLLRDQAMEIADEGHNGWGNTMLDAARAIEQLRIWRGEYICKRCGLREDSERSASHDF